MKTGRPPKYPRTSFGEHIHAARETLGLSQSQVAEKMGVTQTAYAFWERHPVALRPEQIQKIAQVLKVSVETLMGNEQKETRRGGPTGKARRVFDEVSKLPKHRQQRIVSVVEDMLAAHRVAASS